MWLAASLKERGGGGTEYQYIPDRAILGHPGKDHYVGSPSQDIRLQPLMFLQSVSNVLGSLMAFPEVDCR